MTQSRFEGAPVDVRYRGIGLTPRESELLSCEPVVAHAPTYARLFALGVHGRTLTGRDIFDSLHVASVCFLHGGRFEFAHNVRDAEGHALAVIIPTRDEFGETSDLVAWNLDTDAAATWRGVACLLGAESLLAPRIGIEGAHVFPGPLEWLHADREGVVILDAGRARWRLAEERLIVADAAFGRRLRAALRLPDPQIFVPGKRRAAA